MKLKSVADLPDEMQGVWCRQSPLAGVVRAIVICGMLMIPSLIGWKSGQPWLVWTSVALEVCFVPLLVKDVAALCRATNWVLRITSNGVWINLCSYRDKPSAAASVVHLDYREIASAGRHTEVYTTPDETASRASQPGPCGDKCCRDVYLEIQLVHDQTDELKTALNDLRYEAAPGPDPARKVQVQKGPFSVWLVSPSVLRIAWLSSHGNAVAPRLAAVLALLETHVPIAEPTRRERANWFKLTPHEVDELARELLRVHDASSDATALLVRTGRLNYAEATALVQRYPEDWAEGEKKGPPMRASEGL
jgi:hypothetical protein